MIFPHTYLCVYIYIYMYAYAYTECHLCLSTMQPTALGQLSHGIKSLDVVSLRPVYHGADPGHGLSAKQRNLHERRYTGNHRTGVSTWCQGGCSPDRLRAEIRVLDAQSSVRRKLLEGSSKIVQSEYGRRHCMESSKQPSLLLMED